MKTWCTTGTSSGFGRLMSAKVLAAGDRDRRTELTH